jgi:hypothetical protein
MQPVSHNPNFRAVKQRSLQAQGDLTLIRARAGSVRARTGLVNATKLACQKFLSYEPRSRYTGPNHRAVWITAETHL